MNIWDKRFLNIAKEVSSWSKDPSKKVGSVAIDSQRNILSVGYNGFPRNIEDSQDKYLDPETKANLVVHSEANLIYNASFNGISLKGSTLYVYGLPVCSECAKAIAQVGIIRIVTPSYDAIPDKWKKSNKLSIELFKELGIDYECIHL